MNESRVYQQPDILKGEAALTFMERYLALMRDQFEFHNHYLNAFTIKDGEVTGTNPLALTLAKVVLAQMNLRSATLFDLKDELRNPDSFLKGKNIDLGYAVWNAVDHTYNIAQKMITTLDKNQLPAFVSIADAYLIKDSESVFQITPLVHRRAQTLYTSVLSDEGRFRAADIKQSGFPSRLANPDGRIELLTKKESCPGTRTYIPNTGVTRVSFSWDAFLGPVLDASQGNLGQILNPDGRIVVIKNN